MLTNITFNEKNLNEHDKSIKKCWFITINVFSVVVFEVSINYKIVSSNQQQ